MEVWQQNPDSRSTYSLFLHDGLSLWWLSKLPLHQDNDMWSKAPEEATNWTTSEDFYVKQLGSHFCGFEHRFSQFCLSSQRPVEEVVWVWIEVWPGLATEYIDFLIFGQIGASSCVYSQSERSLVEFFGAFLLRLHQTKREKFSNSSSDWDQSQTATLKTPSRPRPAGSDNLD